MSQLITPPPRIEYIDALRGFTMILVVFSHVELFSFGFPSPSPLGDLIVSFFMPLFFFISGYIGYKPNIEWNLNTWLKMFKNKFSTMLIPTLIWGVIYTYIHLNSNIYTFASHNLKLGYWFTIVLWEMFIIINTLNLLVYNSNGKTFKKHQLIGLITLAIIMIAAKFLLRSSPVLDEVGNILSLHNTFRYFPYIAFGYICSMYKSIFNRIISHKHFSLAIIVLYVLLFYVNRHYIFPNISNGILYRSLDLIISLTIGFLGLLIVYNSFRFYQHSFSYDRIFGKVLQYIGKRTLDIYLIHYFLLPQLPQIREMLSIGNNSVLEIAIGGSLSIIIVGVCLVISSILRTSPILAKYLFGIKFQ